MSPRRIAFATTMLLFGVIAAAAGLARSPQLISFASVPLAPTKALAATAPRFQPVSSFQAAPGFRSLAAHPTLVKAILPEKRSPAVLPAVARKRVQRARLSRRNPQPGAPMPNRYFTVTTWQPVAVPRVTMITAQYPQVPQFLYAAVPMRDGWLIIQL